VRDPAVLRYTTGRPPAHVDDTRAFVRDSLDDANTHHWAIRLADGQPVVGMIEFSRDAPARGSMHYTLAAPLWGRGLMTEAARAVCDWAFDALPDLTTIETSVAVANPGSARVVEKLGFERVRRTEETWEKEASAVPLDWYALPRERWAARRTV